MAQLRKLDDLMDVPWGKYRCVLADPPWSFLVRSDRGSARSAAQHYATMDLDAIRALPISGLAHRDAVLLLWVPVPHLALGLDLMRTWGFRYRTVAFNWVKTQKRVPPAPWGERDFFTGMGFWTRKNAELCLLGARGKARRREGATNVRELIIAPRREHSRKPDEQYDRIEQLVDGPHLELFARRTREGWDCFGNEAEKFDQPAPQNRVQRGKLRKDSGHAVREAAAATASRKGLGNRRQDDGRQRRRAAHIAGA